jgi:hypothetical protein
LQGTAFQPCHTGTLARHIAHQFSCTGPDIDYTKALQLKDLTQNGLITSDVSHGFSCRDFEYYQACEITGTQQTGVGTIDFNIREYCVLTPVYSTAGAPAPEKVTEKAEKVTEGLLFDQFLTGR